MVELESSPSLMTLPENQTIISKQVLLPIRPAKCSTQRKASEISRKCIIFCWGPLMDWNLVVRVHDKNVKEGKRLIFPGLCSQPSCSRESARNKEREKGRRKDTGTQVWRNKGALLNSVWLYIPYYKVASSDKDQKTRLYKLPRKQGAIEAIKPKSNPYQKRVIDNPFQCMEKLMKEIVCKNRISLTSVLGVACPSSWSYQELIRNRGFRRDRKQHTGILLLNVSWQFSISIMKTTCVFDVQAKTYSLAGKFWFICCDHKTLHLWVSIYFGLYKILLVEKISVPWKTVKSTWSSSLLKNLKSLGKMKLWSCLKNGRR